MTELPKNLDTILHIGAGHGEELPAYLKTDAKRILLVEPNPNLAEQLRRRAQNDERVQVLELAITDDPALDQLNEYNLPEAASLYRPTGLRQIFPGLRITVQHPVTTQTPEQLLKQYPLEGDHNLLVIQAPGAEPAIVKALASANKLGTISNIRLTLPADVYYEGSDRPEDALQTLAQRGYNTEHTNTQNPDWPEYHLVCNPLARRLQDVDLEKQSLTQALQQSQRKQEGTLSKLDAAEQELAARSEENAQLKDRVQQLQKQISVEKSAHAKVDGELEEHKAYLTKYMQKVEKLEDSLREQSMNNERLSESLLGLQKLLDKKENELSTLKSENDSPTIALGDLSKVRDELKSFFGKKIDTATQQVESTLGMHSYFQTGTLPISYHGWPISPDLALYLIQLQESNHYDLIVEFGSGSSTLLFARCIYRKYYSRAVGATARLDQKTTDALEAGDRGEKWLLPSDKDLPRRVVAFEHKKEFFNSTMKMLEEEGAEAVVDLVYSPLVDYSHKGESYLYYDCFEKFSELKKTLLTENSKVLVLVDGPPKSTGENARFPALPIMLNALSRCSFDVLLDDSDRPGEKVVADKWEALLKKRGVAYKKTSLKFEKGALHFSIGIEKN